MKHCNDKLNTPSDYISLVKRIKEWKDTVLRCNHCGGKCRIAELDGKILLNCTNRFHLNGEYGFYL